MQRIEALTGFASEQRLARLSLDQGLGPETLLEPEPATITLSGIPVAFPVGAFLQATEDGETVLVEAVREALGPATRIADLFAGLGTFALSTRAAYAAEASRDAAAVLKRAPHNWPSSTATSTAVPLPPTSWPRLTAWCSIHLARVPRSKCVRSPARRCAGSPM